MGLLGPRTGPDNWAEEGGAAHVHVHVLMFVRLLMDDRLVLLKATVSSLHLSMSLPSIALPVCLFAA